MRIFDLIAPNRIACCLRSTSKKRVLEQISGLLAESAPGLTESGIFDSLVNRERLGSTGLGHGVAIPHGRMAGLDRPIGAFIRLAHGVDFDAPDNEPVDLVFALLVPEESTDAHLQLLAQLAEMFSDLTLCSRLRQTTNDDELFALIQHWKSQRELA
jgi:nitrogen PTS system EIIA component